MEPAAPLNAPTRAQEAAIKARGNVLVMAGAGTGKTKALVARCLDCLERDHASIEHLLIVTFTEAAAAEMRQRLRQELEKKINGAPGDDHWPRQLALFETAHIGTLHSFCLKLVREHFHEAGLDPQLTLLDEGAARQLAAETLDELFQAAYGSEDAFSLAVQELIQVYANGRDDSVRALVLRLHHYSQTRPDAVAWLVKQRQYFAANAPESWLPWLLEAIQTWRNEWLPALESLEIKGEKVEALAAILKQLPGRPSRENAAEILERVRSVDDDWPTRNSPRKSLNSFFDEAEFLSSLASLHNNIDPLGEDWTWIRGPMDTLLQLTQKFAGKFSDRKRATGVLDFHDLEQSALDLLWNRSTGAPSAIAAFWRQTFKFVFVDEYQDINAAQDQILTALAREGAEANRFLVGDVKQSIYRFRLAEPAIFRDYARRWQGDLGQTIALSDNFRSRAGLLKFVNSVFHQVMREEIGGVAYDHDAALKGGIQVDADHPQPPPVQLLLRRKARAEDTSDGEETNELATLEESAREARLIAGRLQELFVTKHLILDKDSKKMREVQYGDMAILLRSPRGNEDVFTREFVRAGVPLSIARRGFYNSPEVLDLLNLLKLLDNPLQDVPCLAVLRSPIVGLSLNDLAAIRLVCKKEMFWTALQQSRQASSGVAPDLQAKVNRFMTRFDHWRKLARQVSLSQCLEQMLAETAYDDWLSTQPRGEARVANLDLFLRLTRQFDQFQRQGLFRFLQFIEAQQELEAEPEIPAASPLNAVRLMSIHQSKGLEFPVVVVAALNKKFNDQDLRGGIILDEHYGLCPRVKAPTTGRRYPSLPHWLAQQRQKRELRGEELRLLYVAMTRARDTLILSGSVTGKKWETAWTQPTPVTPARIAAAGSFADWIGYWFTHQPTGAATGALAGFTPEFSWALTDESTLNSQPGHATEIPATESVEGGPNHAPQPLDLPGEAIAQKLQAVLGWNYPSEAATRRAAKASVTDLRRAAEMADEEAETPLAKTIIPTTFRARTTAGGKLSAAETGAAHHKFLQQVDLTKINDLVAEAGRMVREHFLTSAERDALDLTALAAFWDSKLGRAICARPPAEVKRELPFTARFTATELETIAGRAAEAIADDEYIVVQGVADLVVLLPEETWLLDFKTDQVSKRELSSKTKIYAPQLRLYASALQKIFSRPVTQCALYFLSAGETVRLEI